jgi:hypothetical protein
VACTSDGRRLVLPSGSLVAALLQAYLKSSQGKEVATSQEFPNGLLSTIRLCFAHVILGLGELL